MRSGTCSAEFSIVVLLEVVVCALFLAATTTSTTTVVAATTTTTTNNNDNKNNDVDDSSSSSSSSSCRLYLAPSNLSRKYRHMLGVYAGKSYNKNEILPNPDIGIPLVDFMTQLHQNHLQSNNGDTSTTNHWNSKIMNYLEQQWWPSSYIGAPYEGNHTSYSFIPGIGALSQYHSLLYNVEFMQSAIYQRNRMSTNITKPKQPHPIRGSITPYDNIAIRATEYIPSGMEIFINHGRDWDQKGIDQFDERYKRDDFQQADKVLKRIVEFMNQYEEQIESDEMKDNLLDFMLDAVLDMNAPDHRIAKNIRSLIPDSVRKLKRIYEKYNGSTFLYRNSNMIKTDAWLTEYGLCIDHLFSDTSTIQGAGRGAFVNKPMSEGDIISPVPMLPIPNEDVLRMYEIVRSNSPPSSEKNHHHSQSQLMYLTSRPLPNVQLVLNYCHAHRDSSLLLLPMAPMVNLINHAPVEPRGTTNKTANAYLTWSKHKHIRNDHALQDRTLDDWNFDQVSSNGGGGAGSGSAFNIVMNLIALRDIQAGEEIFIDYGPIWEEEYYTNHMDTYNTMIEQLSIVQQQQQQRPLTSMSSSSTSSSSSSSLLSSRWELKSEDLRDMYINKPYPVNLKRGMMPYPEGIVTACFIDTDHVPDGVPFTTRDGKHTIRQWIGPTDIFEYDASIHLQICDLIDRNELNTGGTTMRFYNYTVRVYDHTDGITEIINVPHSAITLLDRPYTSDIHINTAFRRWIDIQDQKFPQAWRNLRD